MKSIKILLLLLFISFPLFSEKIWWLSQNETGIGNCGPACNAMVIQWVTGEKKTVEQVRKEIGYTAIDGSTDLIILTNNLRKNNIVIYNIYFDFIEDIKIQINNKRIVIVLLNMIYIKNKKDSFSGKHFVVISNYNKDFFEIQDPLNGSNVFYKIDEVWKSMAKEGLSIWR